MNRDLDLSIAHDKDPSSLHYRPVTWRLGDRPYRTCSYCGSIHPADLLLRLVAVPQLRLAKMLYGWPHKFYGAEDEPFHSAHMLDASPEVFEALAERFSAVGVDFTRNEDGALMYRLHMTRAPV